MKVCIVGAGHVGLVTGASLADMGCEVWCYDSSAERYEALSRGEVPFFEPGLDELVRRHAIEGDLLSFTNDPKQAMRGAEVALLCVGTPALPDGAVDLSAIFDAAMVVARHLDDSFEQVVLAVKSTVPPGTCDRIEARLRELDPSMRVAARFRVCSNPEFLKEGQAVADALRPDRIVVGADDERAFEVMRRLYRSLVRNGHPILEMGRRSAELSKYAANAMLAARISMVNQIAGICEAVGADVEQVRRVVGSDPRIGPAFLYAGIGYGGSCFPKDVCALADVARQHNAHGDLLEAVDRVNRRQRELIALRAAHVLGHSVAGKTVGILGLAFKPNTSDVRESPAVVAAKMLADWGAKVRAHDPEASMTGTIALSGTGAEVVATPYEAARGAHALLLCTEWGAYRSLDFERVLELMEEPNLLDGRGVWDLDELRAMGFNCYGVGRPIDGARGAE